MSLGFRLDRDDGAEAEVVAYAGGWADFSTWMPGYEPVQASHEIDHAKQFADRLDEALKTLIG